MLSYQHIYHAGCLADVHKHASLAVVLQKLIEKDKPLTYIDTHAGRGVYDLNVPEALKTGEAEKGIGRILKDKKIPSSHPFLTLLKQVNDEKNNSYAGSAMIALKMTRPMDVLHLMELHPQEFKALRYLMYPNENVHTHCRDGLEGALALCPPTPRRGLVFIDPSYEIKTDYVTIAQQVLKLHRKWEQGIIMVCYPILKAGLHTELVELLKDLPKLYHNEVTFARPVEDFGMIGSGIMIANAPFGINEELDKIRAWF